MLPPSPFVPLVEVCHALGEPYHRLHNAVVAGRIPAERRGSRWFVTRLQFDKMRREALEERAVEPVVDSAPRARRAS